MIDKRIGKRVKQCRERLGISQEELAEKTGLTANYISTVERGMSFPRCEKLIILLNGLEVSADAIFCDVLEHSTSYKSSELSEKLAVADGLFCREIDGLFCRSSPDIIVRRRCVLSHKRRGWLQPSPSFRYSRNLALQDELYHPVINNGPAVLVCVDKRLGTGPVNQSRDAG